MPFHFELRTDRPILLNHFEPPIATEDILAMVSEVNAWLARLDHRVYYINNLGDTRLSLGDLMDGVQLAARGSAPPLHHPNIVETLVVTTEPMLIMASKSINSYVFGKVQLKVFATLDEALAHVDSHRPG